MTLRCDNLNATGHEVTAMSKCSRVTQETSLRSKQEVNFPGPRFFKPPAIPTTPRILITRGKVASREKNSPVHSGKRGGKMPQLAAVLFAGRIGSREC